MPSTGDENKRPGDIGPEQPTLMARKFMTGQVLGLVEPGQYNALDFHPTYFFFYGTLMDPSQLRKVLGTQELPVLHEVTVEGWKVMMWGQYPALVFKYGSTIRGMAYKVTKESHVEALKHYETDAYKLYGCRIKFDDGTEVGGRTFIFNGDKDLLKEGQFDLKDWQMAKLD